MVLITYQKSILANHMCAHKSLHGMRKEIYQIWSVSERVSGGREAVKNTEGNRNGGEVGEKG